MAGTKRSRVAAAGRGVCARAWEPMSQARQGRGLHGRWGPSTRSNAGGVELAAGEARGEDRAEPGLGGGVTSIAWARSQRGRKRGTRRQGKHLMERRQRQRRQPLGVRNQRLGYKLGQKLGQRPVQKRLRLHMRKQAGDYQPWRKGLRKSPRCWPWRESSRSRVSPRRPPSGWPRR